jgi:hypothetical protein
MPSPRYGSQQLQRRCCGRVLVQRAVWIATKMVRGGGVGNGPAILTLIRSGTARGCAAA